MMSSKKQTIFLLKMMWRDEMNKRYILFSLRGDFGFSVKHQMQNNVSIMQPCVTS